MKRQAPPPSAFSKVSAKSQTVIPREVRERLPVQPLDTRKARANTTNDPFATFSEWSNAADEKAYGDL